jgi:hypothetical protein
MGCCGLIDSARFRFEVTPTVSIKLARGMVTVGRMLQRVGIPYLWETYRVAARIEYDRASDAE